MISSHSFLRKRLQFLRQESAMNRQGSARNRQDSDQLLHTSAPRVECGGLRFSEQNPPHSAGSGGVGKPSHEIIAKIFLSRDLAFLLAARRPPHSTSNCGGRLLFCLLFFDRFLEGIFSIFVHFWDPLGTPKIIKNQKKSISEAFVFPSLCLSCIFT